MLLGNFKKYSLGGVRIMNYICIIDDKEFQIKGIIECIYDAVLILPQCECELLPDSEAISQSPFKTSGRYESIDDDAKEIIEDIKKIYDKDKDAKIHLLIDCVLVENDKRSKFSGKELFVKIYKHFLEKYWKTLFISFMSNTIPATAFKDMRDEIANEIDPSSPMPEIYIKPITYDPANEKNVEKKNDASGLLYSNMGLPEAVKKYYPNDWRKILRSYVDSFVFFAKQPFIN